MRAAPLRKRLAAAFDPPPLRAELRAIDVVRVLHHPASAVPALLLVGWLGSLVAAPPPSPRSRPQRHGWRRRPSGANRAQQRCSSRRLGIGPYRRDVVRAVALVRARDRRIACVRPRGRPTRAVLDGARRVAR
ncbi:MAG: OpcA/G6PD domain-containing protein [Solirubrobacteraceae bacterium]